MTKDAVAGRIRRLLALADKRAISLGSADDRGGRQPGAAAKGLSRDPGVSVSPVGRLRMRNQHIRAGPEASSDHSSRRQRIRRIGRNFFRALADCGGSAAARSRSWRSTT